MASGSRYFAFLAKRFRNFRVGLPHSFNVTKEPRLKLFDDDAVDNMEADPWGGRTLRYESGSCCSIIELTLQHHAIVPIFVDQNNNTKILVGNPVGVASQSVRKPT